MVTALRLTDERRKKTPNVKDMYDGFITPSAFLKEPELGTIYMTEPYDSDQDAIDWKMKKIHHKLFGLWCPIRYELVSKQKVFVPYSLCVFKYDLKRGERMRKLNRSGVIGVITDLNEFHAFHFDLMDDFTLKKRTIGNMKGEIMEPLVADKEIIDNAIETVKWKYLRKVFNAMPELTLLNEVRFYREAWKLTLQARGEIYEKYAYRDKFGLMQENLGGLRARMDI